ncbi:hypothetical protein C8046_07725 [Serinibacter arcticus]|uniref:PDZ domain-containing protein n=1 Tax=Serinibacter arcticus TaxID=1655435 RepID=A0A2U1ZUB1_9MICO|nr:trypsin-like peptidase domain-containing protein [Serinibacter arcticus]PWD50558.1 hypothetical protein C8046_07725 [Serinibacter arcticus]
MDERHPTQPQPEETGRLDRSDGVASAGPAGQQPPSFPPAQQPVVPVAPTAPQPVVPAGQDSGHVFGFGWERPSVQQSAPQQAAEHQAAAHHAAAPQHQQPYPGYASTAAGPGGPVNGSPFVAPAPAPAAEPRRRRQWPAVVTASLLAAVLASGGTALATGAFEQESSNSAYADLGTTTPVAASSATDVEWQALASQVRDSVVAISVTTANGSGAGSGVVIDAENGYVVTNNHVVGGATNGGIAVTLADGRIIEASIVGTDATTDIAVIQLADVPADLKASPWGDSSDVLVGQDVMAVGNPLGLASTVTTGIVSAIDRPVSTSGDDASSAVVTNAIQIDAAINPGNSGGPLFNTAGEVVGINSSIATTSEAAGSIGLGFAIPSSQARSVAEQLVEDGVAEHAYLGVTLSDATATADGVTRAGAKVESVSSDTPASEAGLRAGDVIVGINAKAVGGAEALTGFVRQYVAGDEVTLTVVRGGEAIDVNVTLAVRPETATPAPNQETPEGGSGSDGSGTPSLPDGSQLPQFPGSPWGDGSDGNG